MALVVADQYLPDPARHAAAPQRRLMLAVLKTVLDDCQGTRPVAGERPYSTHRTTQQAIAYVASTDRTWPFSFENVCEAVGVDAYRLRRALTERGGAA